jgi:hypothetical protein
MPSTGLDAPAPPGAPHAARTGTTALLWISETFVLGAGSIAARQDCPGLARYGTYSGKWRQVPAAFAAMLAALPLSRTCCHSRYWQEVRQVAVFQPAVHRDIVIVVVENFGDPARTNAHQLGRLRGRRPGDGVLVLVSPEVPKSWLVTRLPVRLAEMLDRRRWHLGQPGLPPDRGAAVEGSPAWFSRGGRRD